MCYNSTRIGGDFVPCSLYLESAYSFNGSNITINALVQAAHASGMRYLALTDTKMHGAYKFYHAAKQKGIQPILGVQLQMDPFFKDLPLSVVAFARNQEGYANLMRLSSFEDRLSMARLTDYLSGVSLVLNPYDGELKELIREDATRALKSVVEQFVSLAKHVYFGLPENTRAPASIKSVPWDRVCYFKKDDAETYRTLRSILQTQKSSEPQLRNSHFKSSEELQKLFHGESWKDLRAFCENHALSVDFPAPKLPQFPTPKDVSSPRYLKALAIKGLQKRLSGRKVDVSLYDKRLKKELQTIHELGFDDYFLIVWDVIKFARQRNILVGPGRGSAPGSLVAYTLGITNVDPVEHGLLFERFLNKERASMPDIDIDFPDRSRDEILRYVHDKYGDDKVALICTFGTFLSKSSLRDTARVLRIESRYVEELTRKVGEYGSVADMLEKDKDAQNRLHNETTGKWLRVAAKVEGIPRHVSTHAAGIILTDAPLLTHSPLQEGLLGIRQTQYEQGDLEAMGLLKIDFLGLKNLTMIEDVCARVEKYEGRRVDVHKLPLTDKKTFKFLREGSTTGIFQLESRGMRRLIKDMRLQRFSDIAVVLALYRPGPMESIPTYIKRRHNKEKPSGVAPVIDEILRPTEGILLYQEQIMAIAHTFAGYSLSEADILRRAVSKKDRDILMKERKNFVSKATRNRRDEKTAHQIYDYIVKFADYGFNKSHSVAYGLVSYWMAYLKANHPAHFLAVLMQNGLGNEKLMRLYMQEALEHGLNVVPPSINRSNVAFVLDGGSLFYPLSGVKNISRDKAREFVEFRGEARYKTFIEMVQKTRHLFNKRHYEFLIHAGACDEFALNRRTMIKNLEGVVEAVQYGESINLEEFVVSKYEEYDNEILKRYEKEALGFNLAFDELSPYEEFIRKHGYLLPSNLQEAPLRRSLSVVGVLKEVKEVTTKRGDSMAFLTIGDRVASIDAVCFPDNYKRSRRHFGEQVLLFRGQVNLRKGKRQFEIEFVEPLSS